MSSDGVSRMEIAADSTLTIQNVQRSNEGNYSCTVSNHLGSDEIIYPLHVQGKNTFIFTMLTLDSCYTILFKISQIFYICLT